MNLRRWFIASALLLTVKSQAGVLQDDQLQNVDVQDTIEELRRRCEIYEQHDQIYPFKIKVNFRGRFTTIAEQPYCATFNNQGSYVRKVSMKYNRFRTPDEQGSLSLGDALQVPCTQYYAQKYETLNKGPVLSFELANCSEINAENIRQQVVRQLKELVGTTSSSYFISGSEQLQYDSCSNLQDVATVTPGACAK